MKNEPTPCGNPGPDHNCSLPTWPTGPEDNLEELEKKYEECATVTARRRVVLIRAEREASEARTSYREAKTEMDGLARRLGLEVQR